MKLFNIIVRQYDSIMSSLYIDRRACVYMYMCVLFKYHAYKAYYTYYMNVFIYIFVKYRFFLLKYTFISLITPIFDKNLFLSMSPFFFLLLI